MSVSLSASVSIQLNLTCEVCSIASRFYTKRPELHAKLSELARKLAFNVPAQGYKSVEIVQAYLLNTLWGCGPVERYEQDRTWMLLGMAIRFVPSAPFPGAKPPSPRLMTPRCA